MQETGGIMRRYRVGSLFTVAILIITLFFSTLFIAEEMGHHDCTGEDCPICATIEMCISVIKECGAGLIVVMSVSLLLDFVIEKAEVYKRNNISNSLITDKVRMDY